MTKERRGWATWHGPGRRCVRTRGARDNGAEALPWGERRERLPLRWPFAEAVEGYRRKALANPGYDPAATFVWGQMMAVGLIEALKAGEERFGAEGHDVFRGAER